MRRIFEVYFQRNVPSRNEALITFLDGRPFWRSAQVVLDPHAMALATALAGAALGPTPLTARGRPATG